MDSNTAPLVSDLVLIGGGHAHVHVLKMLGMPEGRRTCQEHGIRCTLIARDVHTPYSGMLPGFVSGHYTSDDIHLDLGKLCRFANGVRLIHTSAVSIQHNENGGGGGGVVHCQDGRPPIRYDALSIDIGSTPSGTPDHVVPVKPIAHFSQKYQELTAKIRQQASDYSPENPFVLVVVGGGAGGIELTLSMQYRLQSLLKEAGVDVDALKVILATRGNTMLEQHNSKVRRIFERVLKERRVEIRYGAKVESIEEIKSDNGETGKKKCVLSSDSREQPPIVFDECLWCTSAGTASWLSKSSPFDTTSDGFIKVKDTYESVNASGVFAAGDCCHMVNHPRPKAGVFAVRAGPPLVHNLLAYLTGKPLKPYRPQSKFLGLISTGDKYAVASRGSWFALEGKYIWTWKDHIDRKWMDKYKILPDMEEMAATETRPHKKQRIPAIVASKGSHVMEAFAADPMRCGGCGAKVGATTVSRVLKAVHERQIRRASASGDRDVPPPIDHDDAAIVPIPAHNGTGQPAMICTIDYFRSFVSDPFVFGKISAVHALSDVHAMGASADSALALAVVPFAADEDITESTLVDMLSGASDVFQDEGVRLVGGHTCEGSELACGFSIQGYSQDTTKLLRKKGGRVGDKIVLTKPLGTGALFAADMRAKCRGEHATEALDSMVQSNYHASRIAMEVKGVRSCTDVTGFGLMGHLFEMLMANDDDDGLHRIGAVLNIRDIPFLQGGLEASANEIFSSLQPQNGRNRRAISNHKNAAQACPVEYPLLFDPQTAGGLLFFVAPEDCDELVTKLRLEYRSVAVIGELVEHEEVDSSTDGVGGDGGLCTIGSQGKYTGKRVRINC